MTNSDLPRTALEEGWKGALAGGALGALAGGIPGAVAGAALGHATQNRMPQRQRRAPQAAQPSPAPFSGVKPVANAVKGAFDRVFDTQANRQRKYDQLAAQHQSNLNAVSHDPVLQKQFRREQRPELAQAKAAISGPNRFQRAVSAVRSKFSSPAPAQPAAAPQPTQPSAAPAPAPAPNANAAAQPAAKEPGMFDRNRLNPRARMALKSMSKPKEPSAFAKSFGERVRALKGKPSPAEKASAEKADVNKAASAAAGKYARDTLQTKYRDAIKSGDPNAKKGFAAFKQAGGSASELATKKAERDAKLKTPTIAVKEFTPTSKKAGPGAVNLPKPAQAAPPKREPPMGGKRVAPGILYPHGADSPLFPKRKEPVARGSVKSKSKVTK